MSDLALFVAAVLRDEVVARLKEENDKLKKENDKLMKENAKLNSYKEQIF